LASSLDAHREYYIKRAQLWERQALIKARFVAGDPKLGQDFMHMVHEIVYGRAATAEELEQVRQMRHRIETERGDQEHLDLEFKTGPGGLWMWNFWFRPCSCATVTPTRNCAPPTRWRC